MVSSGYARNAVHGLNGMDEGRVSRRNALKYLGVLTASAAGREFLASWLPMQLVQGDEHGAPVTISGTHHEIQEPDPVATYSPQFFNPDEFRTVEILAAMIIPTDDAPGAKEAKVANYIDFVVFSAAEFEPLLQKQWIDGLSFLERESQKQFSKSFRDVDEADRIKLLTDMSAPERDSKAQHEGFAFFSVVKDMTVEGFYTSKIGLIDVLNYQGMNYMPDFPGCTHPEHH
jgi:gluconate 2-dehydrogenase gamma chain